jgi:hypothetical protein
LPPTLNLPAVISRGLTATRVGDQVKLHWTTPSQTTDKLPIKGPVTAVICRETPAPVRTGQNSGAVPETPHCTAVGRVPVTPGASDAADLLPATLATGPARLLVYRIELLNAAGRTAGPSMAANAAAGLVVQPVADFHGAATKAGVVLEWTAEPGSHETIELERVELNRPAAATANAPAATPGPERLAGLPGRSKEPVETRFRAGTADTGAADVGGTIDRSVRIGTRYSYTAERVRSVAAGGQTLEARSVPSAAVTVDVEDVFPPDAPAGLVAAPGTAGGESAKPVIDLSWEPNMEPRIVGYRIDRRDLDGVTPNAWLRLDAAPVQTTSYRDQNVVAGQRYAYRVTAVNEAGHESAPSSEVTETAPSP